MNAPVAPADPLRQRAFGQWARPSDPYRTVGGWRESYNACPCLRSSGAGAAVDVRASHMRSVRWSRGAAARFRDEPVMNHEG